MQNLSSKHWCGCSGALILAVATVVGISTAFAQDVAPSDDASRSPAIMLPPLPAAPVTMDNASPSGSLQGSDAAQAPAEPATAQKPAESAVVADPATAAEPAVAQEPATTPASVAPASTDTTAPSEASPVPEPVAALPAANQAIKDALDALAKKELPRGSAGTALRKEYEAIAAFYADRNYAPSWSADGAWTTQAKGARTRLEHAAADGLLIKSAALPELGQGDAAKQAASELALSEAVVDYGRQASGGRIDPRSISALIGQKPQAADPAQILSAVASASDGDAALENFNPPQPQYKALRDKLAELRQAPEQNGRLEGEILVNMERWRWMGRDSDMEADRIDVNVPDFSVSLFHDGKVIHQARVVVGKPTTPTPIFSNTMQFVEVNPSWDVPQSIIKKEMMPHLAQDPTYLQRQGYDVTMRHGEMTVRQPPGPKNALGQIKFMFPNDYAVYLHDTPEKALFSASRRAFSHGCVRVQNPMDLAPLVLGSDWPKLKIEKLVGSTTRTIHLPKALPIHIEYFTAWVDDNGKLQVRDDVYGYSRKMMLAMGLQS